MVKDAPSWLFPLFPPSHLGRPTLSIRTRARCMFAQRGEGREKQDICCGDPLKLPAGKGRYKFNEFVELSIFGERKAECSQTMKRSIIALPVGNNFIFHSRPMEENRPGRGCIAHSSAPSSSSSSHRRLDRRRNSSSLPPSHSLCVLIFHRWKEVGGGNE